MPRRLDKPKPLRRWQDWLIRLTVPVLLVAASVGSALFVAWVFGWA